MRELEAAYLAAAEPGIPLFFTNTLTTEPAHRDEFVAALREVLPLARAEATCHHVNAGQSQTDPDVFVLSDGWADLVGYWGPLPAR